MPLKQSREAEKERSRNRGGYALFLDITNVNLSPLGERFFIFIAILKLQLIQMK